ncbi:hypothetical protein BJ912DRAFT_967487 [Pholiota molesta]|nr:hypothetical protein BJ912DRAFT_967487 [Pholiota molesta]
MCAADGLPLPGLQKPERYGRLRVPEDVLVRKRRNHSLAVFSKGKLKYSDSSTMEDTSASEITSNTPLPAYSSVPPSPAVRVPARSRMNMQYMGDMIPTEPTIPNRLCLSYGENANFYSEPEYQDYPQNTGPEFAADNPSDRATVMVYNDRGSYDYYDHNRPAPTPMRRQASTSPALSYVEEHPPSLHSSAAPSTVRDPRAPIDATQAIASEPGTRCRLSLSVHPEPTNDYRKMTLSPSPTSHDTYATRHLLKMLYNLPWVSHERVTARKRRSRPMSSWYHGMIGHSRRSSATLDLLSSGTPSSLGTQPSDRQKSRHHRSRHHQSSSRHHHRRRTEDSRRRKRDTGTSMGTTNTDANHHHHKKSSASPLIPSVYPYHYPPYPYPHSPPSQCPPRSSPNRQPPSQASGQRATSPRGPRGASQQPMMYAAPSAYSPYQPMMGRRSHDGHAHKHGQRQPTPGVPGTAQNIPGAF